MIKLLKNLVLSLTKHNPLRTKFVLFFIPGLLFISCKKEPTPLGEEIIPADAILSTENCTTSEIKSYFFEAEPAIAKNTSKSLLGAYTDPVFGDARAEFMTQLNIPVSTIDFFGDENSTTAVSIHVDSVTMVLSSKGYYGDTTKAFGISIIEVNDFPDSVYSDYSPTYDSLPILNTSLDYAGNFQSGKVGVFEMEIPTSFGQRIVDQRQFTRESFKEYFKGFYFKTETTDGCIVYFDLTRENSFLEISYTQTNYSVDSLGNHIDSTQLNKSIKFTFEDDCNRFNLFWHDYSSTSFNSQLNDSTNQNDLIYLHSMAGINTRLDFSPLLTWKDSGNIAILEAKLIFKNINDPSYTYQAPDYLIIDLETGDDSFIPLANYTIYHGYDGAYNVNANGYEYYITEYFRDLIKGEIAYTDAILKPGKNLAGADRIVLASGTNSDPLELVITYLKPKKL